MILEINGLKYSQFNSWIKFSDKPLLQGDAMEVIGYHQNWVHPDFNPNGTRVGFVTAGVDETDFRFQSARWCDYQDTYENGNDIDDKAEVPEYYMFMPVSKALIGALKKTGIQLIAEERQRQIDVYGYTDEYLVKTEDDYGEGELAQGAAAYALPESLRDYEAFNDGSPYVWPWDRSYWNSSPEDRIKELAKAGAMIVAEIDRLQSTNG